MADREEDARFERASKFLEHNRTLFSQEQLLQCYGLYKQATFGPCNIPKPGILDRTGRAKWCAWNKLKELDPVAARHEYIALMQPHMPEDEQGAPDPGGWVAVSRPKREEEEEAPGDAIDPLVSRIKDGNEDEVRSLLERKDTAAIAERINQPDAAGLAPLHWAADRGNGDILSLVLQVPGVDINLRDADGQTALHYASSCGNVECVRTLLQHGADPTVQDDEGNTCTDIAYDEHTIQLLNCTLDKASD